MLPQSPVECVQDAVVNLLADFRAWFMPQTSLGHAWKTRPFKQAVAACRAALVDDVEAMLTEWRKNENVEGVTVGSTARMPVMFVAVAPVQQPPSVDQIHGTPYWLGAMIPNTDNPVQLRTIPFFVKVQVVYASTNPHDVASICNQLCAYMTDDMKRRILVTYPIGAGVTDQWAATVLENELFPDNVPNEAKNIHIMSVDFNLIGLQPQVIGLDGLWDDVTDNGFDPQTGAMVGSNGGQDTDLPELRDLIIKADAEDQDSGSHGQANADPEAGDSTVQYGGVTE